MILVSIPTGSDMSSHGRYIIVETLISLAINTALSVLFVFLAFHGRSQVSVLGRHGIVLDMVPQTLMIVLMSSLVPALLTHRRLRAGTLRAQSQTRTDTALSVCARALGLAVLTSGMVVTACWLTLPHVLPSGASFRSLLVSKAVYGMLLAMFFTPLAVGRALR